MSIITFVADKSIEFVFDSLSKNSEFFVNTTWLDSSGSNIKESEFGNDVTFKVETKDIPDGTTLNFELFDKDAFFDDKLNQKFSANVASNFAEFTFLLDDKWLKDGGEELDKTIDIYFKVKGTVKGKKVEIDLPKKPDDYLMVYEEEVLITVVVELPHSKVVNIEDKLGLAGHTAMAIDTQFYDFGPDNGVITVDERDYDVDFNGDGDKNDIVTFGSGTGTDPEAATFWFAPGRSWWGKMIDPASPKTVTLSQALSFIALNPGIYGAVYTGEFYVRKNQAEKMNDWWDERYDHLGVYSVNPRSGQQCTTTVKKALRSGDIPIPIGTIRPHGMLWDLQNVVESTSFKRKNQPAVVNLIKSEDPHWTPGAKTWPI